MSTDLFINGSVYQHPRQVKVLTAFSDKHLAESIATFVNEHKRVHHISTTVEVGSGTLNIWKAFIVWSQP